MKKIGARINVRYDDMGVLIMWLLQTAPWHWNSKQNDRNWLIWLFSRQTVKVPWKILCSFIQNTGSRVFLRKKQIRCNFQVGNSCSTDFRGKRINHCSCHRVKWQKCFTLRSKIICYMNDSIDDVSQHPLDPSSGKRSSSVLVLCLVKAPSQTFQLAMQKLVVMNFPLNPYFLGMTFNLKRDLILENAGNLIQGRTHLWKFKRS